MSRPTKDCRRCERYAECAAYGDFSTNDDGDCPSFAETGDERPIAKLRYWVARDEDGALWAYPRKPSRKRPDASRGTWVCDDLERSFVLDRRMFRTLTWRDEPARSSLTIEIRPSRRERMANETHKRHKK